MAKKKKNIISIDKVTAITVRRASLLITIAAILVGSAAYSWMAFNNYNKTVADCNRLIDLAVNRKQLKTVDEAVMNIYRSLDIGEIADTDQSRYVEEMHSYEDNFLEIREMPEYKYLRELTRELNKSMSNVSAIFFMDVDFENERAIYLVDGYIAGQEHYAYQPGTIDFISAKSMKLFKEEHEYRASFNYDSMRKIFYYDYQPVKDGNGHTICYLGIELDVRDVIVGHSWYILVTLLSTAVVATLVTIASVLSARKGMAPIHELTHAARDYSYVYRKRDRITTKFFKGIDGGHVEEFIELVNAMRTMEIGMNVYMEKLSIVTAERERINTELGIANRIQSAMLPCIFPAYPDREEFDIYATMDPAKEVGGDFYDFFLIDDDHLGIVMADVSGKGVPAALFMMASKIMINDRTSSGGTPGKILEQVNDTLCSNNQEEMFVTVWLGILEISTGKMQYANAGHEHPAISHDGVFDLVIERHNFVLGGFEGLKFKTHDSYLKPGDMIFLYTDGVAEATNADNELFGTDRMLTALNKYAAGTPEDILKGVRDEVDAFVEKAPQFDDITMLCLHYKGPVKK